MNTTDGRTHTKKEMKNPKGGIKMSKKKSKEKKISQKERMELGSLMNGEYTQEERFSTLLFLLHTHSEYKNLFYANLINTLQTRLVDDKEWDTLVHRIGNDKDQKVPRTACVTTSGDLLINDKFFDETPDNEMLGVLIHEATHVVLEHCFRIGDNMEYLLNPFLTNAAMDYEVNILVSNMGYSLPENCVPVEKKYDKWLWEKIYEDLKKDAKECPVPLSMLAQRTNPGMTQGKSPKQETLSDLQKKMRQKIVQAAISSEKEIGNLSQKLQEKLKSLTSPKISWQRQLRTFIDEVTKSDLSWSVPNRRLMQNLPDDVYLPGSKSEECFKNVYIAVDNSGSISNEDFRQIMSEINSICRKVEYKELNIIHFDTEISKVEKYSQGEKITEFNRYAQGGTHIPAVTQYIKKTNGDPTFLLVLTDMYSELPKKPRYPVIWGRTGDFDKSKPKYGTCIDIEVEKN